MSQVARGTAFQVSVASVYTTVTGVNNLQLSDTNDMIDVSHLTSGDDKTFTYGLGGGEISFELNYDRSTSTHAALEDAKHAKTTLDCRVNQADGDSHTGTYLVTTFDKTFARDDIQKTSVTLTRTGTATLS